MRNKIPAAQAIGNKLMAIVRRCSSARVMAKNIMLSSKIPPETSSNATIITPMRSQSAALPSSLTTPCLININ